MCIIVTGAKRRHMGEVQKAVVQHWQGQFSLQG